MANTATTDVGYELEQKKANLHEDTDKVDYDELLSSAGEFGKYQILLFLSTFPFYMFGVFAYFGQQFMTEASGNHWCWIPELANLTESERISLAIPADDTSKYGYSHCSAFVANWTEVLATGELPNETWPTGPCQNGWEFDKSKIPYPTISSELGWVCDKASYQATAQAIFFVGSIAGGFIIGWTSDRFGRLPAAVASNMIGCLGGLASTFANNFVQFTICRFIMGMAYDNCMMMVYLIVLEYVAPKYRSLLANMAFALFYSVFVTALPWIALACGHWKTISLVTSLPLALAIFSALIIPESPRWLLSKGRVDEAVEKILVIGRVNKKQIPLKLIEQFKITVAKEPQQETKSVIDIFKRPILRKTLILISLEFMCCGIVFDGLIRTVGQLDFDFFVSFSVISATEFPSMILLCFILDWLGRRWLSVIVMAVSCVFCILTVFMKTGLASVGCAVIARFAVNMSHSACMLWAAELMPTPVRGTGSSFVHICGYVATVISPYIAYLKVYAEWLPLVLIGCTAGLGGIVAIFLPETANKDMPHTFDDAEELARSQKLWDFPCLSKKEINIDEQVNSNFEM